MEANRLPQSNAAALPPPAAAFATMPQDVRSISALTPFPLSHCLPPPSPPVRIPRLPVSNRTEVAGPCLARILETRWKCYRAQLKDCQANFSEAAVHELRVATRRLMAQLVLVECVRPSGPLEKARRILKRRLAALGNLRDTHVQRIFIDHQMARFPELAPLWSWLERRERRLVRSAVKAVSRFKIRKLEKRVAEMAAGLAANGGNTRAQTQLASAVLRATAGAFADVVARRRAIDAADLRTVHQTRVAFKRFRYMVESLSPGLTGLNKRQLRALAYYQRKMGILQDLEVMQKCVASFIQQHAESDQALGPFCRYLRQRRSRALRSFLRSADRLFGFWPPPGSEAADGVGTARNAA